MGGLPFQARRPPGPEIAGRESLSRGPGRLT